MTRLTTRIEKLSVTAVVLAVQLLFASTAHAQSSEDLRKEVAELKARVEQLEAASKARVEVPAQSKAPDEAGAPVSREEFDRVRTKAEALEDQRDAAGFRGLKIGGFFDPTYIYNRDQNRSGFQFLNRVSDDGYNYDNGYFGTAAIDFQKEMEGGTKWRLTLMPNRGAGSIADAAGNSIVHEASVSIPLSDLQTRLIAGQIPDWSGYEYTQPNNSKLVTRGLLLDFTEPTAYTAAGMEVIRGNWDMKAVLGNYNQTKQSRNRKSPVFAYRVDYAKGEFSGFGFAGVHGKATNFSGNVVDPVTLAVIPQPDARLDLFEADGYFIRGDLTLQGQVSLGRQKNASITPAADGSLRDAKWWGVSGLVAYKFIPRWEAAARLDYINNSTNGGGLLQYSAADGRNGIGPDANLGCATALVDGCDKGANRYAFAVGVSYMLTPNTLIKTEYRFDGATQPVFLNAKDGTYGKSNQLLGASVVVSF
jgi:outer membrane murein-binding lipoprotein Lpp